MSVGENLSEVRSSRYSHPIQEKPTINRWISFVQNGSLVRLKGNKQHVSFLSPCPRCWSIHLGHTMSIAVQASAKGLPVVMI
jgi:hypothetical protein